MFAFQESKTIKIIAKRFQTVTRKIETVIMLVMLVTAVPISATLIRSD